MMQSGQQNSTIDEEKSAEKQHSQRVSLLLVIFAFSGVAMSIVFVLFSFQSIGSSSSATAAWTPISETNLDSPNDANFSQTRFMGLLTGQPAPDFTLTSLNDEQMTLSDFRGRPILINFWTTWCAPCRAEMPELERAYKVYADDELVILAVNLTEQDALEDVQTFVDEFQITFPVLLDEESYVAQDLYRLMGLPMSVFVNSHGTINRIHMGGLSYEQLEAFIEELLG
jgi:thiol-disulfide isomerase/thioredoxin